ncbi:hypothetical protein PIB30_071566 [Stylosanthes scabra]|uniref:Uncharacterized protein n=1 Tax=Stylosanthes scabra TaxID=79078 RepID=A0ABU6SNY6_9FABA|nr:hypothetical protein [Stylosanthes scabra]
MIKGTLHGILHHTNPMILDNAYQSNGFDDVYYGYEDPSPPYQPSQSEIVKLFEAFAQERNEIHEVQRKIEIQLDLLIKLATLVIEHLKFSTTLQTYLNPQTLKTSPLNHCRIHGDTLLVDSHNKGWTKHVWDPGKSFKNHNFWGVITCVGAFRDLLSMNWNPLEPTKFKHWWGFKDEFKHKPP